MLDKGNVNNSFRTAFTAEGLQIPESDVDKVMGYRKIEAIQIILKQHAPELAEDHALVYRIHEAFNRDMVSFYENDSDLQPLPFAEELFAEFQQKGIRVGLNTGFTRRITDAILEKLGWDKNKDIDSVICSDEVPEGRPHPFMIRALMESTGITDASQVAKVGDTEVDILEGRNADCGLVVSVTTGAYTAEELKLYKPDFIIDSLQELPAIIDNRDSSFI